MNNLPSSLKPIHPYLIHGNQLEKHDPLMSYYCRLYGLQEGMKLGNQPEIKRFLLSLMEILEKQKNKFG